jgi:trk system potassium uptake protein TrkH
LSPAVQLALILAMAIGGQAGSSAGGIKLFRVSILVQLAKLQVLRPAAGRHAVLWPTVGGHRVDALDVRNAAGIATLFAGTVAVAWLAFLWHGHPPMAALFDVASATFTVGMSAGVVGPELAPALKLVVCALMLLGRLEIVAVVVLLSPRSWWRREARGR